MRGSDGREGEGERGDRGREGEREREEGEENAVGEERQQCSIGVQTPKSPSHQNIPEDSTPNQLSSRRHRLRYYTHHRRRIYCLSHSHSRICSCRGARVAPLAAPPLDVSAGGFVRSGVRSRGLVRPQRQPRNEDGLRSAPKQLALIAQRDELGLGMGA